MFNSFSQNSSLQKSLAALLIITIISLAGGWVLFYPKPAQAWGGIVFDPIHTGKTVYQSIKDAAKWAWEKVKAVAAAARDQIRTVYALWQKSDTLLARASLVAAQIALHTVLNMLTNDLVLWIQGGGEPRFVSDWKGFLKEAGNKAGGLFVDKWLGGGWLCEPIDIDIKTALLRTPTFDERVKCTLEDMGVNIRAFYQDFNEGGWPGWIRLTEPQNNFYGGYMIAQTEKAIEEEKAKDSAESEALAGRGFLSAKVCVKGQTSGDWGIIDSCNDKESCRNLKDSIDPASPIVFTCEEEKTETPASVLSDITSRSMDRPLDTLSRQIADMTDSLGSYAPYVTTVANALINRLIQEGLASLQTSGPSSANPDEPLPPSEPIAEIETPAQAEVAQEMAGFLSEMQELLKENLEDQLLPQQQSNLSVMQSIENTQTSILSALDSIYRYHCSLPYWSSSQVVSTIIEPGSTPVDSDRTIKTIRISASGVGNVLIEETSWEEWDFIDYVTFYSYQTLETNPQISGQILDLQDEINSTNQQIAETTTAISSTNGFIAVVDEYIELYEQTLVPPTEEEQAALDAKRDEVDVALGLLITNGQTAVQSSANNIVDLSNDTQDASLTVNQTVNNLLAIRGYSQDAPEEGTLYEQLTNLQSTYSLAQSDLNQCLNPPEPGGGY